MTRWTSAGTDCHRLTKALIWLMKNRSRTQWARFVKLSETYCRFTLQMCQANMHVIFTQFIKPYESENHHLLITWSLYKGIIAISQSLLHIIGMIKDWCLALIFIYPEVVLKCALKNISWWNSQAIRIPLFVLHRGHLQIYLAVNTFTSCNITFDTLMHQ